MDQEATGVLSWINSFELGQNCASLSDLSNGLILIRICYEISPDHFEVSSLNHEGQGNWVIASSNLKKLMRLLEDYYKTVLSKNIDDLDEIDCDKIARQGDSEMLLSLIQLILGAAVMCENRSEFISRIFSLDQDAQVILKSMIEGAMARVSQADEDDNIHESTTTGSSGGGTHNKDMSEELLRSQELVRHLQDERLRLLKEVTDLEKGKTILQNALETTQNTVHTLEQQLQHAQTYKEKHGDNATSGSTSNLHTTLQTELTDLRRDLDLQIVENNNLKNSLKIAQQRYEASREIQVKLEMEAQQMADELDVTRDKAQKLAKAEATIDKYQKKLEEIVTLKKQNKELSDKLDVYLDKIQDLESNSKNASTLNKMIEQYRDKAIELEREKFEAISAKEITAHELTRLRAELDSTQDAKRFLEEEVETLHAEVQQLTEAQNADIGTSRLHRQGSVDGTADIFEVESIPTLREKIHRLERELNVFKSTTSISGDGSSTNASSTTANHQEIALLQAEIEDIKRVKNEREEALIATKKQVTELQAELNKSNRALNDVERSSILSNTQTNTIRELEQKITIATNTIKMLEEKLKEKEATVDRLEVEKGKLVSYSRKTLSVFKEKYMTALNAMKKEKRALEERVTQLTARLERNQETSRREERLLMSSMYELGVRLMDRKIQEQVLEPSHAQSSFLSSQQRLMSTPGIDSSPRGASYMTSSTGGSSSGIKPSLSSSQLMTPSK